MAHLLFIPSSLALSLAQYLLLGERMDKIEEMYRKAKEIQKISFIRKTILSNACYSTKNMETQIMKAEKNGNLTDEEEKFLGESWDKSRKLSNELLKMWGQYENEKTS